MQDKYNGERVLVYSRAHFDSLGSFEGVCANVDHYLPSMFDKKNTHFHLRIEAEQDETQKQLIPYVIFCHGDQVFTYVRGKAAGENRLIGNRSVGIGGHINPIDEGLFSQDSLSYRRTYDEAVIREITEEVIVNESFSPEIIGLINDDSNPVGRVHLGVVHLCRLSSMNVQKKEQQITMAGFVSLQELAGQRREELESWSRYCVDFLCNHSNLL